MYLLYVYTIFVFLYISLYIFLICNLYIYIYIYIYITPTIIKIYISCEICLIHFLKHFLSFVLCITSLVISKCMILQFHSMTALERFVYSVGLASL